MERLKFVDLFCGLGAFHEALKPYGDCVFASDINPVVSKLYAANHHITPQGDITKIKASDIPAHDVLCAGAPCQSHSVAGKQKALADPRGQLIYDVFRIVEFHKPKYILIENVKNLLNVQKKQVFKGIKAELERLGYTVHHQVMNAARYGMAQARERLYIVCIRRDLNQEFKFPVPLDIPTPVRSILDPTVSIDMTAQINRTHSIEDEDAITPVFKPRTIKILRYKKSGKAGRQGERVYDIDHPSITICASSGGPGAKTGLYEMPDKKIRTLTVKETKRLFGFPESYKHDTICSDTQMLHFLGNSIVIPVLSAIIAGFLRRVPSPHDGASL